MRSPEVIRLMVVMATIGTILSPEIAKAGFDAAILDSYASPDPVGVGQTTTLSARILNTSTRDSGYNGVATFVIQFMIDPPSTSTDYQCDGTFEFQYHETKTISCRYTVGANHIGTHSVEVEVNSPSGRTTWDSASFTFRATNPNPCEGVTCRDSCDGDARLTSGECAVENNRAVCAYLYSENCHQNDFGLCEQYCDGNDVYSRDRLTVYSCRSGSCVSSTQISNVQRVATCGNTCDGNVRVLSQSCSSGQCVGGFRTDCDSYDQTTTAKYCNGNEVWERRNVVDATCGSGACNERRSETTYGVKSCGFGCNPATNDCRQNPCAGVNCPDKCDGDVFSSNGRCAVSNGTASCVYTTTNCNVQDTLGERRNYCNGTEIHSHQTLTDFSCGSGGCSSRVSWTNDRLEENCATRAPTETILSQRCDLNGHVIATYLVTSWVCRGNACESGTTSSTKDIDHGPCASTERCDMTEGRCIPCVSSWMCSEWSACAGQATSTRQCMDVWQCSSSTERPPEVMDCPCEFSQIRWEDGQGNEIDAVSDNDLVTIAVRHHGHCSDTCAPLEVWNDNWVFFPDDGPGDDERFKFPNFCLGNDGAETTQTWRAAFYDKDWSGSNEDYVKVPSYHDFRSAKTLRVTPTFSGVIGDLEAAMRSYPPSPVTTADENDCLREQMETITVTDDCLNLWKRNGAMAEQNLVRLEDRLRSLLEFFFGESVGAFVYMLTCTACPSATVAAAGLCPATGVSCLAIPAAVVCDLGCLGPVGRYLGKIIKWLWGRVLEQFAAKEMDTLVRQGYEAIAAPSANNIREDLVHQAARAADGSTIDTFIIPDRANPGTVIKVETENFLMRVPGGNEFTRLNRDLKQRFGVADNLFHVSDDLFGNTVSHAEMRLNGQVFLGGAINDRLPAYLKDLSGIGDTNPFRILKSITFVPRTTSGTARVFGRTRATSDGLNVIEISLRDSLSRFVNDAVAMIRSFTIPHEIGHAAASTQARQLGYRLRSTEESAEAAIEYLNDVYVLRNLRSTATAKLSDEYAEKKALDMIGVFLESDGVTATSVVEAKVDMFVNDFVVGGPISDSAYELARIRNLVTALRTHAGPSPADKIKLDRISQTINEALTERLEGTNAVFEQMARQKYEDASVQLAGDGETYASRLMSDWHEDTEMLTILCLKYRFIFCDGVSGSLPIIGGESSSRFPTFDVEVGSPPVIWDPVDDLPVLELIRDIPDFSVVPGDRQSETKDESDEIDTKSGGCNCASSQGGAQLAAVFLLAMVARRRTRTR